MKLDNSSIFAYLKTAIEPKIAPIQPPTEAPMMAPILKRSQHWPILETSRVQGGLNEQFEIEVSVAVAKFRGNFY